ncbi:ADP-ribosylation factor-binding protein GGA3-like isoform X2 [Gouania willdenowi]|uniref:ADP-ribosylation factor-binding protein GGA3-like isoform X2 n=1 Tax=Gouania willdenowi TaxID=441366 RepID=UPI001055FBB8|nr:ADP-ribosylation factor-binding protein GGA3-like isoform X2 [Gouania willdenowi]
MASADSSPPFESLLNQATDPDNQEDRCDNIRSFYQLVNEESDGPQVALRLLANKIQSSQEREALQALTAALRENVCSICPKHDKNLGILVLEACMNNCGKRFHCEVAKFRFLNELIKLLTPKYFGAVTAQTVKDRVIEVLYGWTLWLKDEPKIHEAYSMLKKQGILKKTLPPSDTLVMAPPTQKNAESVFNQEEKSKLLGRLIKSTRPEDLELANRLIKSTMKEEEEKAEKISKRESTLKEVESSTTQLKQLLDQNTKMGTSFQATSDVKALYERCDRLRPSLFRLASDTMDDDIALAQILAANDELTLVVNTYKEQMLRGQNNGGRVSNAQENSTSTSSRGIKSYHIIDLSALDSPGTHKKADSLPVFDSSSPVFFSHVESPILPQTDLGSDRSESIPKQNQETPKTYYEELVQLNKDLQFTMTEQIRGKGPLLRARGCKDSSTSCNGTNFGSLPQTQHGVETSSKSEKPCSNQRESSVKLEQSSCHPHLLQHVIVPVEAIRSSQLEPITLFNHAGIHVSLHFARDCPPGHPNIAVVVMSVVNTSAFHVKDLQFQVAVPKSMLVKLQPASGSQLPAYNPLLAPPSISQVLLLANPQRREVRLRYKLTLTHGDQLLCESKQIDSFPDWTSLIGS